MRKVLVIKPVNLPSILELPRLPKLNHKLNHLESIIFGTSLTNHSQAEKDSPLLCRKARTFSFKLRYSGVWGCFYIY